MTAKKKTEGPTETPASQPAEAEKDVVGEAKPVERLDATDISAHLAAQAGRINGILRAETAGNRLTLVVDGPNGLVQTFHATIEEGIREF